MRPAAVPGQAFAAAGPARPASLTPGVPVAEGADHAREPEFSECRTDLKGNDTGVRPRLSWRARGEDIRTVYKRERRRGGSTAGNPPGRASLPRALNHLPRPHISAWPSCSKAAARPRTSRPEPRRRNLMPPSRLCAGRTCTEDLQKAVGRPKAGPPAARGRKARPVSTTEGGGKKAGTRSAHEFDQNIVARGARAVSSRRGRLFLGCVGAEGGPGVTTLTLLLIEACR